jgi:hypothetical protein
MHIKKTSLTGAIVLLSTPLLAQAAAPMAPPLSSYFPKLEPNAGLVADMGNGAGMAVIGLLTPEVTASVRLILDKNPRINTMYIDSQGGDMRAAIALAELTRERKLRLVVAGRCFSACANYIFTAARSKDVLPGSLIGIHGKTYSYNYKDKPLTFSANDKNQVIAASGDPSAPAQIAALDRAERAFNAAVGVSSAYHDAYDRYTAQYRSAPAGSCPAVDYWILRRRDLEKMGVGGMGAVWEPVDQAAAGNAAARFGFNPKTVFFGDPAALAARCQPASGLMAKLRALFD